ACEEPDAPDVVAGPAAGLCSELAKLAVSPWEPGHRQRRRFGHAQGTTAARRRAPPAGISSPMDTGSKVAFGPAHGGESGADSVSIVPCPVGAGAARGGE